MIAPWLAWIFCCATYALGVWIGSRSSTQGMRQVHSARETLNEFRGQLAEAHSQRDAVTIANVDLCVQVAHLTETIEMLRGQ